MPDFEKGDKVRIIRYQHGAPLGEVVTVSSVYEWGKEVYYDYDSGEHVTNFFADFDAVELVCEECDELEKNVTVTDCHFLADVEGGKAPADDPVNHPSHYTFGRFEVLDVIEDWGVNYHLGNAIKYLARAGRKDPAKERQDLEKAVFYINRRINQL
jgi:hypothetical protein